MHLLYCSLSLEYVQICSTGSAATRTIRIYKRTNHKFNFLTVSHPSVHPSAFFALQWGEMKKKRLSMEIQFNLHAYGIEVNHKKSAKVLYIYYILSEGVRPWLKPFISHHHHICTYTTHWMGAMRTDVMHFAIHNVIPLRQQIELILLNQSWILFTESTYHCWFRARNSFSDRIRTCPCSPCPARTWAIYGMNRQICWKSVSLDHRCLHLHNHPIWFALIRRWAMMYYERGVDFLLLYEVSPSSTV